MTVDCDTDLLSKPKPVHPQFNDPGTHVTFQSSDGVLFHLQRKHLEATTGAFPGAEFETNGEITHLTETAAVLAVLFGFIAPKKYPDVEDLEFGLLSEVAEAAEKYEVFGAMEVCRLQLRTFLPKYAMQILAHATKHDGKRLIRDAVPHLARHNLSVVAAMLPSRYVLPWIHYHAAFEKIFASGLTTALSLQVSSPSATIRPVHYFTTSLQTQVCHFCLVSIINTVEELRLLQAMDELKEALGKKRFPIKGCLSTACQYSTAIDKICADMKEKISEVKFEI